MKFEHLNRIKFIVLTVFIFAAVLIVRLFLLQIMRGEEFSETATRQYSKTIPDIFSRGSIFFSEKSGERVSAAGLRTNYILAVNPSKISDVSGLYDGLSGKILMEKQTFLEKLSDKSDTYKIVGKIKGEEEADEIKKENIPYVYTYREKERYYPAGKSAAHVLGIVGRTKEEGERYMGRYGLERQYEDVLHRDSESVYVNFFAEVFSNFKKTISGDLEEMSGDIITSIDPAVENQVEKELDALSEKWQGNICGAIVMDPNDGRIFAMGSLPNFDPNDFSSEKDIGVFRNPLVEGVYEMGSTIKPLTVAAGLDAGVIKAGSTYDDRGYVVLNGKRINNFDGKGRGITTIQSALGNSLNTGMVHIMQKLGAQKFSSYFTAFGLGEKTGIDLPGEESGLVNNLKSNYEVDYATASFGQGIAVTPIQTIRALAALSNGGFLVTPSVVDGIKYRIGTEKKVIKPEPEKIIGSSTSEEITRMLVRVVDENLLGGVYKLKNYSVAAKTGTALLPDSGTGGYYSEKYLHSFFGYFPAYEPKFIIFLFITDPKGVDYASHSLTEPFFNIAKFLISYYNIPPDR